MTVFFSLYTKYHWITNIQKCVIFSSLTPNNAKNIVITVFWRFFIALK